MINKFKNINKKLIIKTVTYIIGFILLLYLLVFIYSYVFEQDKIAIDKYNFEQLEKVRNTLDGQEKYSYKFLNLKEYNKIFNQNIKTIKNCYYLSSDNGKESYIFGFKLESFIYKIKYLSNSYVYPKYDINLCTGSCSGVTIYDRYFKETIYNPCQD